MFNVLFLQKDFNKVTKTKNIAIFIVLRKWKKQKIERQRSQNLIEKRPLFINIEHDVALQ
jgi:hypothetical protein